MELPTRKKHCTCLEFVDSTSNDWLFGNDVLVTNESSSTIVDLFIMDNQLNPPVIDENG